MFKKRKIKKIKRSVAQKNRKWKLMIIPKDKDKSVRVLRYLEAENGEKVFVEKLGNYNLYIVSAGTNPGAVNVSNVAENLKSALLLANNKLADMKKRPTNR